MDVRRFDSSDKRVFKYVFEPGNAIYEAVVYRYPNWNTRTVICCSVQSGCPVGCTFCGSGGKFIRNLTDEEIILGQGKR
jgi:23S rRNA (adenine2503-C2)-methyltransferase